MVNFEAGNWNGLRHMDKWKVENVAALLEECGRVALSMSAAPESEFKGDRSLVTAADRAIEAMLSKEFDRPGEGIFLIGEETISSRDEAYQRAALERTAWIVDPIDGTALFAHGVPLWGISVALAEGGVIREGAIFMPAIGEMLVSCSGSALHGDCGSRAAEWNFPKSLAPMKRPESSFDDGGIVGLSQRMAKKGVFKGANPVQALCSCVYSTASLATGRHLSYVLGAKIWDVAGSLPFLKALGFAGRLQDGTDVMTLSIDSQRYLLDFNSPKAWSVKGHLILAPGEEALSEVMSRCEFPG